MRTSVDDAAPTPERYRAFATVEAVGMSACYEEWALGVADDAEVVEAIDELPPHKRQPNLVFGAARFLGIGAQPYARFRARLLADWPHVRAVAASHATQTNEPGRCATLLPALAALRGPLALLEVGASAGLCLYPDRYSYRYDDGVALDPEDGPSAVVLDCAVEGAPPRPARLPEVVWRAGIDLNPLDVRDEEDVRWLDALIWPEHADRRARLRAAVGIARAEPPDIRRGDLDETLAALVEEAPAGASLVVFHTAVLAYLPSGERSRFARAVRELPATWISNEGRSVVAEIAAREVDPPVPTSDFVLAVDGEQVAFTQPHGRRIHWLGTA